MGPTVHFEDGQGGLDGRPIRHWLAAQDGTLNVAVVVANGDGSVDVFSSPFDLRREPPMPVVREIMVYEPWEPVPLTLNPRTWIRAWRKRGRVRTINTPVLTQEEMDVVERYLAKKYGVELEGE